jgi:2-methylisocitrate lyase-like PEP mutase family enzyme
VDAKRLNWKRLLDEHKPLLLPAAHDALTARILERAGFPAYQVGGFALEGAEYGLPDIDISRFGEKSAVVRHIMAVCKLPVLIDIDDGYGDVKNVTHTIHAYEDMGVSAAFLEDQKPPKRCGHLSGKQVIAARVMVEKINAAVEARHHPDSVYLIARTDAIASDGLGEAIKRGHMYLEAGADAVYLEGPTSVGQLEKIAREFRGAAQVTNILEGGGKTPWVAPKELAAMGYNMVLYPTSILFRLTKTIERAVADVKAGLPMPQQEAVTLDQFEEIVGLPYWKSIEERYQHSQEEHLGLKNWLKYNAKKLFKPAA